MVRMTFVNQKNGQWILLSGLVISLIIIGLSILLNQAMLSSHQSAQAEQTFPKKDILELRSETFKEAIRININENVTNDEFNRTMDKFLENLETLYLMQGEHVNLIVFDTGEGTAISVKIEFDDGITKYSETGII
jgi:hypothetical protein